MLIPTRLGPSEIHGVGVFTEVALVKGQLLWEFTPGFDRVFPAEALDALTPMQRETFMHYAYVDPGSGLVVLCCDNGRFFNFSENANTTSAGTTKFSLDGEQVDKTFAARDIAIGEELTYPLEEDADAEAKMGL